MTKTLSNEKADECLYIVAATNAISCLCQIPTIIICTGIALQLPPSNWLYTLESSLFLFKSAINFPVILYFSIELKETMYYVFGKVFFLEVGR